MVESEHGEQLRQDLPGGWELLDREIETAGREAISSLVANADREALVGALAVAGSGHLDPRFVRRGADRLLRRRLPHLSRGDALDLVGRLGRSMLKVVRETSVDSHLSGSALEAALPSLLERWSPGAIRLELAFLATSADEGLASAAHRLVEEDPRLALPTAEAGRARSAERHTDSEMDDPDSYRRSAPPQSKTDLDADPPTMDDEVEDEQESALTGDDISLFTTVDQVMIKQAVASYTGVVGALAVDDMHRLADELVRLNTDRHASFFHLGFLDGLDDAYSPDLPAEVMNGHRRQWFAFGKLTGLVRREHQDAILELARASKYEIASIVRHPSQGRAVVAPLVRALLEPEPMHAAELLHLRLLVEEPFTDLPAVLHRTHQRARALLLEQRADEAEALWRALTLAPQDLLRQLGIGSERRLISCARARNDFPTALERVEALDTSTDDPHERAVLETERGLIAAEISHLKVVSLGSSDTHRRNLTARLERGRHHFEQALRIDPQEWRASLCLGVLYALTKQPEPAAPLLERARSALLNDPLAASTRLGAEVQFLAALVRLRCLEEGTDGRAFKDVAETLNTDGWSPPVADLLEVVELLTVHGSRHSAQLLALVADHAPATKLAPLTLHLLGNDELAAAPTAARLARSAKVDAATRIELLTLALDTTWNRPGHDVDALVDQLDDLLREVSDDDADRRLQVWLNDSMTPNELYGAFGVEHLRILLHERLGEFDTARQLLERLIHRSLAASTWERPYDLDELLDHHRRRDPDGDRSGALATLIRSDREAPDEATDPIVEQRDVRLLFVGGDERQQRITSEIEARTREVVPGTVHVTWIHPGWSARWLEHAEHAEAEYDRSDALVLMPLVRTNLGRRLRRTSGEAGLPWVACTGHGVDSITRAISKAAQVVRSSMS